MSLVSNEALIGAAGQGGAYEIEQSLRFDGGAYLDAPFTDAYLESTWSFWAKRTKTSGEDTILWVDGAGDNHWGFRFGGGGDFTLFKTASGSDSSTTTDGKYRDPGAWYHVLVVSEYPENQNYIYINGVLQKQGSYQWNFISATQRIGYRSGSDSWNGYLAEFHHIYQQAKSPSDFGEFDNNGVWRPIEYTGTYGSKGYYLKFDPSASNGIGHDHSGNGNHFTASGFTTSGTGTDVMSDTPTNNFCTLNPLYYTGSGITQSEGNLKVTFPNAPPNGMRGGTLATTNAFYFEAQATAASSNQVFVGVQPPDWANNTTTYPGKGPDGWGYQASGSIVNNNSTVTTVSSWTAGDIIGVACHPNDGTIEFYKNGTSVYSGTSVANVPMTIGVAQVGGSGNSGTFVVNCGQREFAYPPGTASATSYFNTVTYTGNASTQSITGVGFQPDFVWIKNRSTSFSHALWDSVRGVTKELNSNGTGAEGTVAAGLTSFDSDGFSLGSNTGVNNNSDSFVAWCWKAGGTASSNTNGSITSSVSANQTAGFSVVSYTGTGSAATIGHGLGVAPKMMIIKNRDSSVEQWHVYHESIGNGYVVWLNSTAAQYGSYSDFWNSTSPTSTVFTVGTANGTNKSGDDLIAYCFAEKTGISKFGSYTGNGSTTGPYIECGFKPRMVMVKRTDAVSNWFMYDTIRGTNNKLYADANAVENGEDGGSATSNTILSLSDGFQMTSGNGSNSSGGTYIFMAFAENFSADTTFKSLNTSNIPAPTIKDGSKNFNIVLYAGNTTSQSITGFGFQPDWAWVKKRNGFQDHEIQDAVRGATKSISSSLSNAESTDSQSITSFTTDGFNIGSSNSVNENRNYVAWAWKANGSGSSNTDGTITSTVSVNATAGFSIISFTGTGSAASIGHGLGVKPGLVIGKDRDRAVEWKVYFPILGNYVELSSTAAQSSVSNAFTGATSSVLNLQGSGYGLNYSGDKSIVYCFAEVEGYSKFGSYTGNGNADGPFVYCGFKPAWILIKRTNTTGAWKIFDNKRPNAYNVIETRIEADSGSSEGTDSSYSIDLVSNGFKLRGTSGEQNGSSDTFVFAALASNPFGGSGATPVTAR